MTIVPSKSPTQSTQAGNVRPLHLTDLRRVAQLHLAAFPKSVLAALGQGVLLKYYEWQLCGPHDALALGVEHEGELVGFCVAGVFQGALTGFLQANQFLLIRSVLRRPWLALKPRNRRRVFSAVRIVFPAIARFSAPCLPRWLPPRSFGVLALAIDPKHRRSGYGRLLIEECEVVAMERGFSRLQLTVDPGNQTAIEFYTRLGWTKLVIEGRWDNTMFKMLPQVSITPPTGR